MSNSSSGEFLLQRWTNCLACGRHYENVLYRCLQCSDFGPLAASQTTPKSGRMDSSSGRLLHANYPHASSSSVSPPLRDYYDMHPLDRQYEDRTAMDTFHVCPECVRRASLFHPVRHVFVRVDISWIIRMTDTTASLMRTGESYSDLFDAPTSQTSTCTLGKHRSRVHTADDALIWQNFLHSRLLTIPGLRNMRTINTKYHKESCARCKSRICGIRWERLCTSIEPTSPTAAPVAVPPLVKSSSTPAAGSAQSSALLSRPDQPRGSTFSSMRYYTQGLPPFVESPTQSPDPQQHLPGLSASSPGVNSNTVTAPTPSLHSLPSIPTLGKLTTMATTLASSIVTGVAGHVFHSPCPIDFLGGKRGKPEQISATAHNPIINSTPTTPVVVVAPPRVSLCMHCFDTLHSDFAASPLCHKVVGSPDHEDAYYHGSLWAHVRCLFDSATQPIILSIADEEEIERADSAIRQHHHHHHHSHSNVQASSGDEAKRAPSGSSLSNSSDTPSMWERRHIGSDQSGHSSSSGSGSTNSYPPQLPGDASPSRARADRLPIKASTVHIEGAEDPLSQDWLLLDTIETMTPEYMSDEEHLYDTCSPSDSDEDTDKSLLERFHLESENDLVEAGKRALNMLAQDDVMRPAEVRDVIEPFMNGLDTMNTVQPLLDDNDPITSTITGESPFVLEEPEPVFEITPDLRSELVAHKARSIFEYGLDREAVMAGSVQRIGGLPSLESYGIDPVVPMPRPKVAESYGSSDSYTSSAYPFSVKTESVPSSSSASTEPPGYWNPLTNTRTYGTPYLPSINSEGSISESDGAVPDAAVMAAAAPTPYVAPDHHAVIGYDTAPSDTFSAPSAGTSNAVAHLSGAATYYASGDSAPPSTSSSQEKKPEPVASTPTATVVQTPQAENPVEENHRDWNGEWQGLITQLMEHRTECLHQIVTTPADMEDFSDKEKSIASLLHEAGLLGMESLNDLYSAVYISDSTEAPTIMEQVHNLHEEVWGTDSVAKVVSVVSEDPSQALDRIGQLQAHLSELTTLKADKGRTAQLMLCLIRVKSFLREFIETACRVAQTIVSEVTLPFERKTIKPRRLGGIAGGEKFLEEGIFFKFAIDAYAVYGGDKFAMKAAGHEIQGLKAYAETDTPGLCIPLSTIIDYAGYRVVASARLPISADTLIYGSSDGGATIHKKDPVFNKMMEDAASQLNIKQHEVSPGVSLYSAVDMEGHKGADGRYYVLDTARVFPPEPPLRTFIAAVIPSDSTSAHKWAASAPICELELIANRSRWREQVRTYLLQGHRNLIVDHINLLDGQVFFIKDAGRTFSLNSRASALVSKVVRGPAIYVIEPGQQSTQLFNLLRANYVARQPYPLSSDAFTSFGRINADVHNTEVEDAFYRLLGIDIPNFVKYLTARQHINLTHDHLINTIKTYGINLRLLGFLRSHIPIEPANRALRSTLLVEMVTRVAKNDLRASLRSARRIQKNFEICLTPLMCERQAHEIILSTFNLLLGNSTSSTFMWHSFMKTHIICKYGQYGQALTEAELDPSCDLRREVNKLQLFQTLQSHVGVRFKDSVLVKFQKHPEYFEATAPFGPDDIESLYPKPKMLMEVKLRHFFNATIKTLPSITMRMEALRGYFGSDSHELGFTALMLAHVLNRFDATRVKVPSVIRTVFHVFANAPGTTPAEVTCKALLLLSSANLSAGHTDLAEGQLKASYNCYRRALSSHVSSKPMELGAAFLLLVLDRLVNLLYKQNRKFESWYYAQKFVRIWHSMPYPGDMKDLEPALGRPTPLAFALLWERDYHFNAGQRLFYQNGTVTDPLGNVYTKTEDFILDRRSGRAVRKSNLIDENLQELPELTPEIRMQLEHDFYKATSPETELEAAGWRGNFKTVDFSALSGFNMASEVWMEWVESGMWKKERVFDSRVMKTAIWTPATSLLYSNTIIRPNSGSPSEVYDEFIGLHDSHPIPTTPNMKHQGAHNVIVSTPSQTTIGGTKPPPVGHDYLILSSSSTSSNSSSAALPINLPDYTDVDTPLAGTIIAPHVLPSGKTTSFTFRWHIGREWAHEVTGTESFVLVRQKPNLWLVPTFVSGKAIKSLAKEAAKLVIGTSVGQYIEGGHEIVATKPARLIRSFSSETWENLDLEYGSYQVHLVSSGGRLWGRTTSKPCFVISNHTVVLNRAARHHVLRWNEPAAWTSPVMQAEGIQVTSMSHIPLGSGYSVAYWTDGNGQLWYGFQEPHQYVPHYLTRQLPVEEILRIQEAPLIPPAPTDFANTFHNLVAHLHVEASALQSQSGSNISASTSSSGKPKNPPTTEKSTTSAGAATSSGVKSSRSVPGIPHSSSSSASVSLTASNKSNKPKEEVEPDVVTLHFDSHGIRTAGPGAVNTIITKKEIESQISPSILWNKMRKVPSLAGEKVAKVVASNSHVMALMANGDVYTWGNNLYGELGHGDLVHIEEPRVVKRLRGKQVRDIAAGVARSVALLAGNRTVYQWGLDFQLFPEPHPFWKSLPDEEVTKVVFQSQNGIGSPHSFDPENYSSMPPVPRDISSYGIFEAKHNVTANSLWHSNLMLYLTDTGRVYVYGHDPHQILFRAQHPILLDIFDNHPILDADMGSNFMAFIGEEGTVWTTGYNELGQRGTGVVGDPSIRMLEHPLRRSGHSHRGDPTSPRAGAGGGSGQGHHHHKSKSVSMEEMSSNLERLTHKGGSTAPGTPAPHHTSGSSVSPKNSPSTSPYPPSISVSESISPMPTRAGDKSAKRDDISPVVTRRGHGSSPVPRRLNTSGGGGGGTSSSTGGGSGSGNVGSGNPANLAGGNGIWEEENGVHPMVAATLPGTASKVSFPEPARAVRLSVRGKKIYAVTDEGIVWHWGDGTYVPAKLEVSSSFIVVSVLASSTGAALHTGPTALPLQVLTERGRTRRKALGLETPNHFGIRARHMLLTVHGLKPYVEGTPVPSKAHVVVAIDWKRPPPGSIEDHGEEIRFVTPGLDYIKDAPKSVSEIALFLPHLPRQGQLVVDYLQPKVTRWSIDQGIAHGNVDRYLEPLLEWAPITDESRETLLRRRDKRAAQVRALLLERQTRLQQEARQLAEVIKSGESRTFSMPSTASSSFSTLPSLGANALPSLMELTSPKVGRVSGAAAPSSPLVNVAANSSGAAGNSAMNFGPASASYAFERPPLLSRQSKSLLTRANSSTSLSNLISPIQARNDASVMPALSTSPAKAAHPGASSSGWDGTAAMFEAESSSTGVPASLEDLSDSAITNSSIDQEEFAPMVPPGEYEAIYVVTKPHFQIVARSNPIRFSYDGIKSSIDIESTTVVGDKPLIAHWKCELRLGGLAIVARELESKTIVASELLRQRTADTVKWRLRVGMSYRLYIERTDESGGPPVALCESSVVECLSSNPALSAFGNSSFLSALSTIPIDVECCSEWSTFFKQCQGLPIDAIIKYSSMLTAADIPTSFAPSLDSGILEKLGITNLHHQVAILNNVRNHWETNIRAFLAAELRNILDTNGSLSQYETASNSSFVNH